MNTSASPRVWALLVAIDQYPEAAKIPHLEGCLNDQQAMKAFLEEYYQAEILLLSNEGATRQALIEGFRKYLGQAQSGDSILFHYAGHGSFQPAAEKFRRYFNDGKDQTLVCYDSRLPEADHWDLADKELAILLAELAQKELHITVILDSCHSGSGTRAAEDAKLLGSRYLDGRKDVRPIESYLEGYYLKYDTIPDSKHILLAACDPYERAWESSEEHGVFTHGLLHSLHAHKAQVSYADLYLETRMAVKRVTGRQHPQFETFQYFNAYERFLGGKTLQAAKRYQVYFDRDPRIEAWVVNAGAVDKLPTSGKQPIELAIYKPAEAEQTRVQVAQTRVTSVGISRSVLAYKDEAKGLVYDAELLSVPTPPHLIFVPASAPFRNILINTYQHVFAYLNLHFVAEREWASYAIQEEADTWQLWDVHRSLLIQQSRGESAQALSHLLATLEKVLNWEHAWTLQNERSEFDPAWIELALEVKRGKVADTSYQRLEGAPATLAINEHERVPFRIIAQNNLKLRPEPLNYVLFYLSNRYGIYPLGQGKLKGDARAVCIYGGTPNHFFALGPEAHKGQERIQLLLSTHEIDSFLITQKDLELGALVDFEGRTKGDSRSISTAHLLTLANIRFDWFTRSLTYQLDLD